MTSRHPLAAWAARLAARFDGAVMRVEPPQAVAPLPHPPSAAQQVAWARLQAWCFDGALPAVARRFAIATLATGPEDERASVVEAFSRHLDGSDQLAATGGGVAGVLLRLRVKRNDAFWWRARQPSDPWDCGYLVGEPHALQRFQPRRATLLVADGLENAALREAVRILRGRSPGFHQPVRLLVVGRNIDALAWSSTPSSSEAITEMAWPPSMAEPASAASESIASASR